MSQNIKTTILVKRFLADQNIIHTGNALDIGFGYGNDALALAEAGYSVIAVDKDPEVIKKVERELEKNGINFQHSDIKNFAVDPNTYSIIVASNILPFINSKEEVLNLLSCFVRGLRKKGYLIFSLFGLRDEWKERADMSFFEYNEVVDFLKSQPIEIYFQSTEEGYGPTKTGITKYWHIHRFIVCKD